MSRKFIILAFYMKKIITWEGTAEDIAGVCLFLASGLSEYVTGQKNFVGGGMEYPIP